MEGDSGFTGELHRFGLEVLIQFYVRLSRDLLCCNR